MTPYNTITKLVAIDNGYWSTKVFTNDNQFFFRSKYEKTDDTFNKNNTYSLFYEEESYIVGDGATQDNIDYDKTQNELAKICTYTALSKISNCVGTNFNLMVGYPLKLYSTNKEIFADYLKTDGFIDCEINSEKKVFNVSNVIVLPQGAGALYSDVNRFKNKIIAILDIGGLTVNGCIFDNLNLIRNTIFTEDLGIFILYNEIKKALDSQFGINIQEYEIPDIVRYGLKMNNGKYKNESLITVNEVMQKHVEDIKKICKKNKWNIGNLEILLIGGGSLVLKNQLLNQIPYSSLTENPLNDNVKGFYKAGELLGY